MLFYNLVVRLYGLFIRLASLRSKKARQWVEGRKNWQTFYINEISKLGKSEIVWVHCASYGEFEQGRPLIDAIKKKSSSVKIVLTFFSPSGYEAFKNWEGADIIGYLPLDTKRNASKFLEIVKPSTAIFIKYEFWLNFLFEIKNRGIKNYLVSAVFKPHHPFFKWYGGVFRKSLNTFDKLFIQDEDSGKLLDSINVANFEVSGDTRFDRVVEIRDNMQPLSYFDEFCSGKKIIVAGSTWPGDEKLLVSVFSQFQNKDIKLILVPHNVDEGSIKSVTNLLNENKLAYTLYSQQNPRADASVLVVDAMGLLSKLYFYATVAYIGGGFEDGIHNCLEASVYLKPVVFGGNDFHKFNEAVDLLKLGAAKNVMSETEASAALSDYLDGKGKVEIENKLTNYFNEKSGTTKKILELIKL